MLTNPILTPNLKRNLILTHNTNRTPRKRETTKSGNGEVGTAKWETAKWEDMIFSCVVDAFSMDIACYNRERFLC